MHLLHSIYQENLMRSYVLKMAIVSIIVLLTGCQTTPMTRSSANIFNVTPAPAEVNLAQLVQDALMRSGDPQISQVSVQTNQNTVILSGYVKKIRQSDFAEQIARRVNGVQRVENRIIIRP